MRLARAAALILLTLLLTPWTPGDSLAEDAPPAPGPAAASAPAAAAPSTPAAPDAEAAGEALDEAATGDDAAALEPPPSVVDGFFTDLSVANLEQKSEAFYAPTAVYEDPTGRYEGRAAVLAHLKSLVGGAQALSIDVKEEFVSGEETVALWTLTVAHPSLGAGEPVVVEGVSHVRVQDGKAVYQRDYYDLGGAVYEHVSVIGRLVRWVKAKL